jgi:acyl-CoA synthetase (AMP-forming)/AMP-acid ligase II
MPEPLVLPETVQTIPETIAWWARQTPEAPALLALNHPPLSYRALHQRIGAGIAHLRRLGIGQRDRVALVLEDNVDDNATLLAVMSAAIAAPLSPLLSPAELARDLRRLDAAALVVGAGADPATVAIAADLGLPVLPPERFVGPMESCSAAPGPPLTAAPAADDVMLIAHTSGTTALPKRVPITHRMQLVAARARNCQRGIGPDDVCLLLAPGHTVMFLTNFITMLAAGGGTIRVPSREPSLCLRANAELQPTWILAPPPLYRAMLRLMPENPAAFTTPRLRLVNWGGAGADPALAHRLEAGFGVPSDGNYGLSEASAIATPGLPGSARPGSAGKAAAAEIRVVDDRGQPRGTGATGEIVVRGPSVFGGYLDDADATAAAFLPGGWFRTGDLGYLDRDGWLFLTGRVNEQINRGGTKIAPVEVEHILLAHPAVRDAAVFGVPDAVLGEDAVAAVVLQPGVTASPRTLRAWMLDRLEPARVPRRVWFVPDLPRTGSGKVQRRQLAERFRARDGR